MILSGVEVKLAMIRHWTSFNGRPNWSYRDKVRVTLNFKSMLLLNRTAFEQLGRPTAVELFFDRTYGIIGVKKTRPDAHNAFPVKAVPNSSHRKIYISSFCVNFDIKIDRTVVFFDAFVNPDGMLELSLAKISRASRGAR